MSKRIDPSDERALAALPEGTRIRVVTAGGATVDAVRVRWGWYVPGDLVVSDADVTEGGQLSVTVLDEEEK